MVELAVLPTPLLPMPRLGAEIGVGELLLKDDGPSSAAYGGNKVRKLELLLGAARAAGAREVMTFGYAGSNHATATAVHAAALGMRSISMLMPQENAKYLRTNLLVSAAAGAELHEYDSVSAVAAGVLWQTLRHRLRTGRAPYRVDPGGSNALGTIGFVAAAFELIAQMQERGLPAPAAVYVACGSMGSAIGLALGFALLAVPTRVMAVRVTDAQYVNVRRGRGLWEATAGLLRRSDPSTAPPPFDESRLEICEGYYGGVYARATPQSAQAARMAADLEGLELDVSYTAKTMACLIERARSGLAPEGSIVFWNTYSTVDLSASTSGVGVADLPARLQRYFA